MIRRLLPRRMLHQLMLLTSAALLIAIIAEAAYSLREQGTIARTSIEQQASALARNLAIASAGPLVLGSFDTLDELMGRSIDFPDVIELRLVDAGGKLLSHFERTDRRIRQLIDPPGLRLVLPAGPRPLVTVEMVDGRERMVAWHSISAGSLLGWVRVDFSTAALDDARRRILTTTLITSILATTGVSLLLFVFLSRPMRALERARRFAVNLSSSQGKKLLPLPGPIEIEDLQTAMNYASVSLHEQRGQLADIIEQLRIKESVLGDRNAQLDAIFALSPDGFVSFDGTRRVKYVSPAFLRLLEVDESTVAGLGEDEFSRWLTSICIPAAMFPGVAAMREALGRSTAAIDESAPGDQGRHLIELAFSRKRVLEVRLCLSDNDTVSHILYFSDVTHETEVDRMKSEFLSHAAHELRTPMASIFGFSELLLEMDLDEVTRRDLLETIHRQTKWLVEIINELLDLSRIESRRGADFTIEDVDLTALVRNTLADLATDGERWPLVLDLPQAPVRVPTDASKLRQALTNVIGNAQKYSPDGGEIRISIRHDQGRLGIEVSDRGVGMTPEQLARLGERFWRADTSGKIPGSGLGVAIVKEIMKLLGGDIEVRSQPNVGTKLTLWLCPTSM